MFRDYVLVDVPRFARLLGVPLVLADSFPLVPTAASRAYYWLHDQDPRLAHAFARGAYHAFFGQGRDISKVDELRAVADSCGADGEALAEATRDQAVKDLFRRKNDAALAKGVFGSPYILVDGEPFWGADRLYQVEEWLATGGW